MFSFFFYTDVDVFVNFPRFVMQGGVFACMDWTFGSTKIAKQEDAFRARTLVLISSCFFCWFFLSFLCSNTFNTLQPSSEKLLHAFFLVNLRFHFVFVLSFLFAETFAEVVRMSGLEWALLAPWTTQCRVSAIVTGSQLLLSFSYYWSISPSSSHPRRLHIKEVTIFSIMI